MADRKDDVQRRCPGEKYDITLAICRAREANHYPKCLLCAFHEGEGNQTPSSDPKVGAGIFGPDAVLGKVPAEMDEYVMRKVGVAAAQFLRAGSSGASRLVVASDLRETSRALCRAFCEGVNEGGMDTLALGIAPADLLFFVLGTDDAAGAALISGGNSTPEVNGVWLFASDCTPITLSTGLDKIGFIARRLRSGRSRTPGENGFLDPRADYRSFVLTFAPKLEPLKVVVDACCGVSARLVPFVFENSPVEIIPLHFETEDRTRFLGGDFPTPAISSAVKAKVTASRAHLGAAIDFTGERIAFFDEQGARLQDEAAGALIAAELLLHSPSGRIVYDLRCSAALRDGVLKAGGQAFPCPTGPLSLGREMRKKDGLYGLDPSGRHFFKGFFHSPSPIVALLLMCSRLGRSDVALSKLTSGFKSFSHSGELCFKMPSADAAASVISDLKGSAGDAKIELLDGLTARYADCWFNLRQPEGLAELRLNVEGKTAAVQRRLRLRLTRLIRKAQGATKS